MKTSLTNEAEILQKHILDKYISHSDFDSLFIFTQTTCNVIKTISYTMLYRKPLLMQIKSIQHFSKIKGLKQWIPRRHKGLLSKKDSSLIINYVVWKIYWHLDKFKQLTNLLWSAAVYSSKSRTPVKFLLGPVSYNS